MMSPYLKTRLKPTPTVPLRRYACFPSRPQIGSKTGSSTPTTTEAGTDDPTIRFDNHHGVHELHLSSEIVEIDYPGLTQILRAWRAALPEERRDDW